MPNEKMKKQSALAPFRKRLRAACSVYYSSKLSWLALAFVFFLPSHLILMGNNLGIKNIRHKIQFTKRLIRNAKKQVSWESEQQQNEWLLSLDKELAERLKSQREVFSFQVPLAMTLAMLGGNFFMIHMRHQFSNPRSVLSPGFACPHLVAGMSGILLITISYSGFAWYWTGASFVNCFVLALFSSAFVVNANRYKSGLLAFIHILIPLACFILMTTKSSLVANYIEGRYPLLALAFSLISFISIALFAQRLMHFDEEQPEYSPLSSMPDLKDIFTRPDSKIQEARQKPFLKKQGWHLWAMDWLSQYFQYRALRNDKLNRTLSWQVPRGGQAVILMGHTIVLMIISGLVLFITERYIRYLDGVFQLGDAGIPLVLVVPLSGMLLIILVMSWVQTRPLLQVELLRPMSRADFVRSLMRTHLLEVSLIALPVLLGNVVLTLMFHSDMHYILSSLILMCSITLLLICAVPWLISFRSTIPAFFMIVIGQVMIMVLITKNTFIQKLIFTFWVQGLFFTSVIIVGILMLFDTKRRWMKTEFGR